ncbi:MAG: alpha amylase catalytic region, partial [Microvirga sp.]|nr:alpha amylase catalytic region [Microvirga sp.]
MSSPQVDPIEQRQGRTVSPADSLLVSSQKARTKSTSQKAPRIYYVHPLLVGPLNNWDDIFDHAASLGFDTILMAPPFEPGHGGSILLPRDMTRLHPDLGGGEAAEGVARLAEKAGSRTLTLALDLVIDRVAADSDFARELGLTASSPDTFDPRQDPAEREAVLVPFDDVDRDDHPHLRILGQRLRNLTQAGVSGFRCLHWD